MVSVRLTQICMSFHHLRYLLVGGLWDNSIRIINPRTKSSVFSVLAHVDVVTALAIDSAGKVDTQEKSVEVFYASNALFIPSILSPSRYYSADVEMGQPRSGSTTPPARAKQLHPKSLFYLGPFTFTTDTPPVSWHVLSALSLIL